MLAMLQGADRMPWPDLMTAMAAEHRAFSLGRLAGEEGTKLVTYIMEETERLFMTAEQAGVDAFASSPVGGA